MKEGHILRISIKNYADFQHSSGGHSLLDNISRTRASRKHRALSK